MDIPTIPGLPEYEYYDRLWNMSYEYRESYVSTKYSVALRLQPERICEIGVYSGIAALCFLAACPTAEYVGIDDLSAEHARELVPKTGALLTSLGYRNTIHAGVGSRDIVNLPGGEFDLVHVDGDHSRIGTCLDVILAWKAMPSGGYILIDNGHDTAVAAGTFDALRMFPKFSILNWEYLNEGVGSILIARPSE